MQLANCVVHLKDAEHNRTFQTVSKTGVTPAEVMVLRAIHGPEAVPDATIKPYHEGKHRAGQEKRRLLMHYGAEAPHNVALIERLFPGAVPAMPRRFAEIPAPTVDLDAVEAMGDDVKSERTGSVLSGAEGLDEGDEDDAEPGTGDDENDDKD